MSTDNAYLGSATRRRLLTATPGSLLWALAGGLGTGAQIATAQPLQAGAVPEVDRLAVRVVTDSYHHAFEASRTVGEVQLQRVGNALKPNAQPRTLLNEWGLSLHLESSARRRTAPGADRLRLHRGHAQQQPRPAGRRSGAARRTACSRTATMTTSAAWWASCRRKAPSWQGPALLPRRRGMLLHPRGRHRRRAWATSARWTARRSATRACSGELRGEAQRGWPATASPPAASRARASSACCRPPE